MGTVLPNSWRGLKPPTHDPESSLCTRLGAIFWPWHTSDSHPTFPQILSYVREAAALRMKTEKRWEGKAKENYRRQREDEKCMKIARQDCNWKPQKEKETYFDAFSGITKKEVTTHHSWNVNWARKGKNCVYQVRQNVQGSVCFLEGHFGRCVYTWMAPGLGMTL